MTTTPKITKTKILVEIENRWYYVDAPLDDKYYFYNQDKNVDGLIQFKALVTDLVPVSIGEVSK